MISRLRKFGTYGVEGLGSTTNTQAQIVAAANQYGVDPNLALAVAKQESGYQQTGSSGNTLTSSAGALGVFQLMPATAAGLGVNPNDQSQNIEGGVKLLNQLLTQYNGNVSLALAAYNAGPGAVAKYNGVPPYPETQNYVASINASYAAMGGGATSTPTSMPANPSTNPPDAFDSTTYPTDGGMSADAANPSATPTPSITDTLNNMDPVTVGVVGIGIAGILYVLFG